MIALPNYEIKRVIGSGSFGKFKKSLDKITQIFLLGYVFEAYDNTNQRTVALKRIQKVGKKLSREYEILLDIKDCDYVVKMIVRNIEFQQGLTNLF